MSWRASILTLFPEMFPGPLALALSGKALKKGLWSAETVDIRDFSEDRNFRVDDTPYGGGPGMVLRPDAVDRAIKSVKHPEDKRPLLFLSPRGQKLTHSLVREWAGGEGVILLCGRYEGIDERVIEAHRPLEVCVGDFILSGGEIPALLVLDACIRLLDGVMGNKETATEESFSNGLLEYPHYTSPALWEGKEVPPVLLSGNHGEIAKWRLAEAKKITEERRPDLWELYQARQSREKT